MSGKGWHRIVEAGVRGIVERTVIRRLSVPGRVRVVAVGGATFGGSGKTPLAMACAAELAAAGARVVFVGHAFRADPRRARFVAVDDPLTEVGDEAILAARALEPVGARVVVAPSRASALTFAASAADVLVVDGVAQLSPVRASLALLAVDGREPWGRVPATPPRGALRAPIGMLLGACDAVVPMDVATTFPVAPLLGLSDIQRSPADAMPEVWPARVESRGAWVNGGTLMTWERLRATRVGLIAALARPDRVVRSLARRGVTPRTVVFGRDHGPLTARARRLVATARSVDLWLATPKCALHLVGNSANLPLAVIDHRVILHPSLCTRLKLPGGAICEQP